MPDKSDFTKTVRIDLMPEDLDAPSSAAASADKLSRVNWSTRNRMTAAAAANMARELAHQPPNVVNPVSLAARAQEFAAGAGLTCRIVDHKQMKRLKMGAILAVGQGSDSPPRLIVIEYRGAGGGRPISEPQEPSRPWLQGVPYVLGTRIPPKLRRCSRRLV